MDEYIERESAIKSLLNDCLGQVSYSREDAADCIFWLDTADVAPVRHGRWDNCAMTVPGAKGQTYHRYRCSKCHAKEKNKAELLPQLWLSHGWR